VIYTDTQLLPELPDPARAVVDQDFDQTIRKCVRLAQSGGRYQLFKLAFVEVIKHFAKLRHALRVNPQASAIDSFWSDAGLYTLCLKAVGEVVGLDVIIMCLAL
jgi:hypothetical protein